MLKNEKINKWGKNCFNNVTKCPICNSKKIKKINNIQSKIKEINGFFDMMQCKNCLHRCLSKLPTDSFLTNLYKKGSHLLCYDEGEKLQEYNTFVKKNFKQITPYDDHWILKYIDIKKRGKYFELGPGLCGMYKTFYSQGWNCQGLEPRSIIKAPGIKRKINQIIGKVDIIVAFDVLEHVTDPLKYLKLLNTKLKKGGKIFLTFPNAESFKSKILKDKWSMVAPLGHVNFFSKKSVKIMFMKSGFETLILKDFSLVDPRRLVRNLLKLPFKCLKDIILLKFNSLFQRFGEFFMNCLDLINGDQLKVVGKKIQK
mgnify:FL=1